MDILKKINNPIIKKVKYNSFKSELDDSLHNSQEKDFILKYPTVYVINNAKSNKHSESFAVYVGETNDIKQRTTEHLNNDVKNRIDFQKFAGDKNTEMYVIGHDHFNKSLTMDIENKMMLYMSGVDAVSKLNNRRENQQNDYYTSNEMEAIFSKIWKKLHAFNKNLFPLEETIESSAIFKASPFHKLTTEQKMAKDTILERVSETLKQNNTDHQLILVEGEAGSGKTVLMSTIFYLLYELGNDANYPEFNDLDCRILVNQDEQVKVYKTLVHKLQLGKKGQTKIASKPTAFINNTSLDEPVDVSLVDEAHLLWTQGKQSYRGKNQLEDIIKRSKITIAIFDKHQVIRTQGYLEEQQVKALERMAQKNNNLIFLENQLRMNANKATVTWIRNLVKGNIENIPTDDKYEIKIFNDPNKMHKAISNKNQHDGDNGLSRMLATFDWNYTANKKNPNDTEGYWQVKFDNFSLPWNNQLPSKHKKLAWAEQPQTINEIGSTFTIQGFDLNYSGVIIGPSVKFRDGKVIYDPNESKNKNAIQKRTLSTNETKYVADELLPNELNVLLTRGVHGLYIYAVDEQLRKELLKASK